MSLNQVVNHGGGVARGAKLPVHLSESINIGLKIKKRSDRSRRCVIVVEDPDHVIEGVEFEQHDDGSALIGIDLR